MTSIKNAASMSSKETKETKKEVKTTPRTQTENRSRRRPQCASCRQKLTVVFSVCLCNRLYCSKCINPRTHECPRMQDFINSQKREDGLIDIGDG